jgi:protein PhnA
LAPFLCLPDELQKKRMRTLVSSILIERCEGACELCSTGKASIAYAVSPESNDRIENEVALCETCFSLLSDKNSSQHWQCLAGSIWNAEPSVQALSYRILYTNKGQEWADDLLNSIEPDEKIMNWALSVFQEADVHKDSNGTTLNNGDTIVLTQNMNVKGASFTAPKGTVVRKIRLVPGNTEQIEGKINDQTIVILTKYVRKSA